MDKQTFERNLLALSKRDPLLCTKLSAAVTTGGVYRFLEARSGDIIPALTGLNGAAHSLHSTVDPRKEGERLFSTITPAEEGFIVFLGLGGAFAIQSALAYRTTKKILVIEYNFNGVAELLSSIDYIALFQDPRFRLLVDPSAMELEAYILNNYIPAADGGIQVIPLRTRSDADNRFLNASEAIKRAIDTVSRDYSVQAFFGKRWFSNSIRNIFLAEKQTGCILPVKRVLVCAAGPSLEEQIPLIKKELVQTEVFLIATDTSLPALLKRGIEPDAVISIDCQYISYLHFFETLPAKTRLFLDLASPPLIAERTENRFFFSGGHPLTLYMSRSWRSLPVLDTSGANVTYTALSLAENLGAREIKLYGADFSYPGGKTYARGTYIYNYFDTLQFRYNPIESQHSAFLYRDSSLTKKIKKQDEWYYETKTMRFYREKVHQKETAIGAAKQRPLSFFSSGSAYKSALEFLKSYKKSITELCSFDSILHHEQNEQAEIAATLLPLAAYIKRKRPLLNSAGLFEEVKSCSIKELEKIIP